MGREKTGFMSNHLADDAGWIAIYGRHMEPGPEYGDGLKDALDVCQLQLDQVKLHCWSTAYGKAN